MSIRVLIVDDHELIRLATRQLVTLAEDMKCVDAVGDLGSAEQVLSENVVDVVICDLKLKAGNVLKWMEAQLRLLDLRFLICSAMRSELFGPLCQQHGASGFVPKTDSPSDLLDAIRDVAGRSASSESHSSRFTYADNAVGRRLLGLSPREWEVLLEIGSGLGTKEIARRLYLSEKTVESHRIRIKQKMELDSKDELVRIAAELHDVLAE